MLRWASMNTGTYFYQDKQLFGLDIGFSSLKVMQVEWVNKQPTVIGYGIGAFDDKAIKDGVIIDPELVARAAQELFKQHLVGEITTRRVAVAVPASRTFSRGIKLPKLNNKELAEAVLTEAEQYIPMPVGELYLDYDVISRSEQEIELFAVAIPKKIIDSYVTLVRLMGLEVVTMETSIGAAARLFLKTELTDVPTLLIDFGSISTDITIFDKNLIVTGTVAGGGDDFTARIAEKLGVTKAEAHIIKTKYGLDFSKKQKDIKEALSPMLELLLKEIRRMIRYYEERYGSTKKISQVVTMGGGANMPGLNALMTDLLRLPVHTSDPWQHIKFSKLQPPNNLERSMYVTVSGLSLMNPKEIFK